MHNASAMGLGHNNHSKKPIKTLQMAATGFTAQGRSITSRTSLTSTLLLLGRVALVRGAAAYVYLFYY